MKSKTKLIVTHGTVLFESRQRLKKCWEFLETRDAIQNLKKSPCALKTNRKTVNKSCRWCKMLSYFYTSMQTRIEKQ